MSAIKFVSKDAQEIHFSKELKKRVHKYFKDGNISTHGGMKMYVKSLVMLAMYIMPFVLILTVNMPIWAALLLLVVMGIGEAGIGMSVMHDATHGAYSKKSWVNTLFGSSMFLLGSNTLNWKIQHIVQHHTFTNIYEHDPDIDSKAILRLCDHAPLKGIHRFQQYYAFPLYGLMTIFRFFTELNVFLKYNKMGLVKKMKANATVEIVKLILTKIVYLALTIGLPLAFTPYSIWQILIGFMLMHIVAGAIMGTVFQMAHVVMGIDQPLDDEGVISSQRLVHQLETTSNFGRKGGLLSWYIGGLDFQIEHHLFPTVCHVHYPSIAPIVENLANELGLQYHSNRNFSNAIVSHFRRLKQLGTA